MSLLISPELAEVLGVYKRYNVRYDEKNKIVYVNKGIPPIDFYTLRYRLKNVPEEILDLRVYHERISYVRNEEGCLCQRKN